MGNDDLGGAEGNQNVGARNTDRIDGGRTPQRDADRDANERQSFDRGIEDAAGEAQRDGDQMVRDQLAHDENQQIDPAAERGGGRMFTGQDSGSESMIGTTANGISGQDDTISSFGGGTHRAAESGLRHGGLGSGGQGMGGTMDDQGEEGRDR